MAKPFLRIIIHTNICCIVDHGLEVPQKGLFALFGLPKPACTFALLRYSSSSLIVLQPCAQLDGIPEYRNMISTEGKLELHILP